jgi:hypothetical protein
VWGGGYFGILEGKKNFRSKPRVARLSEEKTVFLCQRRKCREMPGNDVFLNDNWHKTKQK